MKIEQILQQDDSVRDIESLAIIHKGEVYTFFDKGNTRNVFVNDSKTKVIKLLINKRDKDFNLEEIEIYKDASDSVKEQMAYTSSDYDGYVVEQEFCLPVKYVKREMTIAQILFASSCRNEVGWTKDGRLVCFDLDEFKKY